MFEGAQMTAEKLVYILRSPQTAHNLRDSTSHKAESEQHDNKSPCKSVRFFAGDADIGSPEDMQEKTADGLQSSLTESSHYTCDDQEDTWEVDKRVQLEANSETLSDTSLTLSWRATSLNNEDDDEEWYMGEKHNAVS